MPISRTQAILRLIAIWCDRTIEDDYGICVALADILQPEIVDAVAQRDLFPEYDLEQRLDRLAQTEREAQRGQELIRAWLAPRRSSGGVQ